MTVAERRERMAEGREREAELDSGGMRGHILELPEQLARGTERALGFVLDLPPYDPPPSSITVTGMGGSAISGDLVAACTVDRRRLPLFVRRGYELPAGLDGDALVIAASYSGDTEETLSTYQAAKERKLRAIALTSGGRLAERAGAAGDPCFLLPGGYPPRAALGHAFSACGLIVGRLDPALDARDMATSFDQAADALRPSVAKWLAWEAGNPALEVAESFVDGLGLVYAGHPVSYSAAIRWKTQFNENAKLPVWTAEFPEQNHNELVGFVAAHPAVRKWSVAWLETPWDGERIGRRFEFVHAYLAEKGADQHRIAAGGRTPLEAGIRLCALGDAASFLASIIAGQDPTPVAPIDDLKRALAGPLNRPLKVR